MTPRLLLAQHPSKFLSDQVFSICEWLGPHRQEVMAHALLALGR